MSLSDVHRLFLTKAGRTEGENNSVALCVKLSVFCVVITFGNSCDKPGVTRSPEPVNIVVNRES
jgi:hypothetical protein